MPPLRPFLVPSLLALTGAVGGACARPAPPPPLPEAGQMRHFEIPWANAFPSDVAVDGRGRLWFTDRLTHAVAMFDPATERFQRFHTPTPRSAPYGLIRAPDGTLWFGESNAGRLGRIDPVTEDMTEVEIPGLEHAGPMLLAWADDAVWFTSRDRGGLIGRYHVGRRESRLWKGVIDDRIYGIAATPDGQVWVVAYEGSRLVRVDESRRGEQEVDLAVPYLDTFSPAELQEMSPVVRERLSDDSVSLGAKRIASGPEGRIWISAYGPGHVTGVDPATGDTVHVRTVEQPSRPYGITVDDLGRVWFSEQGNDLLVVYDPRTDRRSAVPLPLPGGTVRSIAVDVERGRVWLPLSDIGVIGLLELQ